MELARGGYLAWADADDISLPERLRRQVDFLDSRREVVLVGSPAQVIDGNDRPVGRLPAPADPLTIRWASLLSNPFITSAVMMRGETVRRHGLRFDPDCQLAQDFDLWTKLLRHGQGANLAEPLVRYRVHATNQTSRNRSLQLHHHERIILRTIREVMPGFAIADEEVVRLRAAISGDGPAARLALGQRYLELFGAFCRQHGSSPPLRREAAWTLVRHFARPYGSIASIGLLAQALALDPGLPIHVLRRLAGRVLG